MENNTMEITALQKFKEIMVSESEKELDLKDSQCLRFLKARNYNLDKAEIMLRAHLEWKKSVKLDQAGSWKITPALLKAFPYTLDGLDKDGRATFYLPVGTWEVGNYLISGQGETDKFIYHTMAKCEEMIERTEFAQFVIILDLAGLSYRQVSNYGAFQLMLGIFREFEANFPERLYLAVVINSPWVFSIILPSIQAIFAPGVADKVKIFDKDSSTYLPHLLNIIPRHGFPTGFKEKYADLLNTWCNKDNSHNK